MTTPLNLKEIEKRAFRATYQDGLWDIYYGLIVIFMAVFIYRPESGYSSVNLLLALGGMLLSYALFLAAKKFITTPRLGQVQFGELRKQKRKTMGIILGVFIFCQLLLVIATMFGYLNHDFGQVLYRILGANDSSLLVVSTIASVIVGSSMMVMAYFADFLRGYYISLLMALAVFLMVFFNQPLLPVMIGTLIVIPGVVLLVRFIRRYPLPAQEKSDD